MFGDRVDNVALVNVSGNCSVATAVIVIVGDVVPTRSDLRHSGDVERRHGNAEMDSKCFMNVELKVMKTMTNGVRKNRETKPGVM